MDLEKIVSELVEKRFAEAVIASVNGETSEGYTRYSDGLRNALESRIAQIVAEEIVKRDDEIRRHVVARLTTEIAQNKVSIVVSSSRF